jgi:hypothetical protein
MPPVGAPPQDQLTINVGFFQIQFRSGARLSQHMLKRQGDRA